MAEGGRNRLDDAASPYLKQHADNPVHWQPWDAAALAEAAERDVPILLSVGYASCHWCHVMAHESFEDEAVAALMNADFVCIKVDREERPDLDRVYQTAHQILTQQPGGWPLTVFLDPRDQVPFFSGTYFPRTPRYGMPGFVDLLQRVSTVWREKRDDLAEQAAKVQEIFDALNSPAEQAPAEADAALLSAAREALGNAFDSTDGGFGNAPKFPMPTLIMRLLRHWAASKKGGETDGEALEMALHTLTRMARGGLFDHLGGGFCRYSTDGQWLVPHFEKMLYDNGALLGVYADAMAISPDPLLETAVRDTAGWMLREMRSPEGAFFAALDADSEGEEGRFYVWHRESVKKALDREEYDLVATLYGLDKPPNFPAEKPDTWILHRRDAWRAVVERLDLDADVAAERLASARTRLLEVREQRERPGLDDKVLVAWNGLAISGLARAARVLGVELWGDVAREAADAIRTHCVSGGRLHASLADGRLGVAGFLEDHAQMLDAQLELLALGWRDVDARFAVELADALLAHFHDDAHGGFYQTAHDAERLIHRPKPSMDEALPAGNAVAARALGRLGHLLGRTDYLDAAAGVLRWAAPMVKRAPQAHCAMLDALEDQLTPPEQVVVRGAEADAWGREAREGFRPDRDVWVLPTTIEPAPGHEAPLLPEYLPDEMPAETTAWVCTAGRCSLPITDRAGLTAELGGSKVVTLRPRS
jgi:uncharacterized protein YyaL (SSP411 family)